MSTDIGPKIGIQGEAEYKRSMKELAAATKTLGTEAKLITSEFAGEEKSTQALTAKNDVLQRSVYQLNDVLEKQEEHLKQVARAYGEADSRTQKAQQEVNKTKTEINKFNAEIKNNNEQIASNGTAFGKLGNALGGFTDKLGLGNTALGKMTSSLSNGTLATTALSAAVVKLASDLVKLSDAAAKHADSINTMATNYGIAVQDLQKFSYMAELTDVSVETITGSMSKLVKNMNSARDGTGAAAEAFAQLGVRVTDSNGQLRNSNEVFMEAIDALGRVGNETEKDTLAMSIFGKSAMELNGIIAQGADGLAALANEAANSGYVMSDKMVNVLQEGQDATDRFDKSMEGLKNTIGAGVTPVVAGWKMIVAEAADDMAVFIQNLAGMRDEADETANSIQGTTDAVTGLSSALRELDTSDALDMLPKDRAEYVKYLRQANATQQELGYNIGIASYENWKTAYDKATGSQPIVVQSNITLDNQTLGRAVTPVVNARNAQRGNAF